MKNLRNKLALTMIGFLLTLVSVDAQVWNTVGSGLSQAPHDRQVSTVSNGELYVATSRTGTVPSTVDVYVEKWNGLTWFSYPVLTMPSFGNNVLLDMEFYNGNIYLCTWQSLKVFDGTSWNDWLTGFSGTVRVLKEGGGSLFVGGDFTATTPNVTDAFLYDGSNFTTFPPLPAVNLYRGITDMEYYNNAYHISYEDTAYNLGNTSALRFNGVAWEGVANTVVGTTPSNTWFNGKLFEMAGDLYEILDGRIYLLQTDTAYDIAPFSFLNTFEISHNSYAYLGAGTQGFYRFDGNTVAQLVGSPDSLWTGQSYAGELYCFGAPKIYNGVQHNHAFRTDTTFSMLNGVVYADLNSDCYKGFGEPGIQGMLVALGPQLALSTNVDGRYSFGLPSGTYSINSVQPLPLVAKNWTTSCPLPGTISLGPNQTVTQDIAMQNTVPMDMVVQLNANIGWRARQGFTEAYTLTVLNTGTTTLSNATLTLELPSNINFVSSVPSPSTNANNVLTFTLPSILPFGVVDIDLMATIDLAQTNLGDTLCWSSYLSSISNEADPSDNADTLYQMVVAAVDPNDKAASANQILPGTQFIDYHINFQNTGTDTAVKVTIVDTLDTSLPLTSVIIGQASHNFSFSVVNNVLIWEFHNINLPDSGASYMGSQGFATFRANVNPLLGVGDTIDNDAEIYFDYQPPVHTNHAKTAIVNTIGVPQNNLRPDKISIYPNPASEHIHIKSQMTDRSIVNLIDGTGRLIDVIELDPGTVSDYSIEKLKPGVYLLKVEGIDSEAHQLLITR